MGRMRVLYSIIILIKGETAPAVFVATFQSLNKKVLYSSMKKSTDFS